MKNRLEQALLACRVTVGAGILIGAGIFPCSFLFAEPAAPTTGPAQPISASGRIIRWECDLPALEEDPRKRTRRKFEIELPFDTRAVDRAVASFDRDRHHALTRAGADHLAAGYHQALCTGIAERDMLARRLLGVTRGLSTVDRTAVVLNLASGVRYRTGRIGVRLPIQTLWDNQGDCDEKALLSCWLICGLNQFGEDIGFGMVVTPPAVRGGRVQATGHAGVSVAISSPVPDTWARVQVDDLVQVVTDVSRQASPCWLGAWDTESYGDVQLMVLPDLRPIPCDVFYGTDEESRVDPRQRPDMRDLNGWYDQFWIAEGSRMYEKDPWNARFHIAGSRDRLLIEGKTRAPDGRVFDFAVSNAEWDGSVLSVSASLLVTGFQGTFRFNLIDGGLRQERVARGVKASVWLRTNRRGW